MALVALSWPAAFGDVAGALERLDERLARETRAGDVVLLPELCLTGYVSARGDFDLTPFAEPVDGPTAERLAELSRKHALTLAAPLVERAADAFHNTLLLLGPRGELQGAYRKRHPWYPETWATGGTQPYPSLSLGGRLTSACICFDLHFVAAEAAAALHAAEVLLFPSAWVEDEDSRESTLTNLARRFDLVIVNANWAPGDVQLAGQGRSMILTAAGVVASAEGASAARW